MNILALSINFNGWVADTIYYEQVALQEYFAKRGSNFILYGPGFRYNNNHVPDIIDEYEREGVKIDCIICYRGPQELLRSKPLDTDKASRFGISADKLVFPLGLDKVEHIPKVFWMNDFWQLNPNEWDHVLLKNGFQSVFSVYAPFHIDPEVFIGTFSSEVRKRVEFILYPRALDPERFSTYSLEGRVWDVTRLGAISPKLYPVRVYMDETLKYQSHLKILQKNHPGYKYCDNFSRSLVGSQYREALAKSKIIASCCTRYQVPLIKVHEAIASGAVFVTDRIRNAKLLGLEEGIHYIETSPSKFMACLYDLLSDESKMRRISEASRDLFLEKHTTAVRSSEAYEYFKKIVSQGVSVNSDICLPSIKKQKKTLKFKLKREANRLLSKVKQEEELYLPHSELDWSIVSNYVDLDNSYQNRISGDFSDSSSIDDNLTEFLGTIQSALKGYQAVYLSDRDDNKEIYMEALSANGPASAYFDYKDHIKRLKQTVDGWLPLKGSKVKSLDNIQNSLVLINVSSTYDLSNVIELLFCSDPSNVLIVMNVNDENNCIERSVSEACKRVEARCDIAISSARFGNLAIISTRLLNFSPFIEHVES
ncbi:glycosyltransferase family protein [Flexibacterium corallicola]|uniref:glycosyltransferase family protein n=1 Tax=Flexibacterium corallicola TaxID=3037259 RepID=UPI00286F75D6|nr:hypothetical protein [Pseudovibrio sp. M1P-2-3]